ncbi:MAG TPA: dihydrolipoamide acetyltransferase family protein [Nocardioidaceae bacterium]|nr:dihydrolipoamide acetyltransferase family protein [Nocardioidaceae bacterium]
MPEFKMPSLGADMDSGTLVEWLVKPGDTIHRGDPMAVVDTDKSAIEVESFDDGVVESFLVEPGTRVAVGTPLASLTALGATAAAPAPAVPVPAPATAGTEHAAAPAPTVVAETKKPRRIGAPPLRHHAAELGVDLAQVTGSGAHGEVTRRDVDRAAAGRARRVSPYARRLAGELGVDLTELAGSGRGGSIRADDVLGAVAARARTSAPEERAVEETATSRGEAPPAAAAAAAPAPSVAALTPRTGSSRATIAALMSRAKREIPHYYVATTVDLAALTGWLRRTNRERAVSDRLVPAAALLKATALAARAHPELNGFWVDDRFVPGDDVHLGVAVAVRDGALVAPAIHHTADLELPELMAALRDLVKRARAGRLRRAELADPTLTVTDLGDQGVEEVIGVIYPPQVALLGVGRITDRPWAVDGLIGVRPTVRLTLSGDHRATDGATGARFLNYLEGLLQQPEEL